MHTTVFLFLALLAFGASAQEKQSAGDFSRFQVGISFSPDDNYRGGAGSSLFGYTTGLSGVYALTTHLGIETGVQFSRKAYGFVDASYDMGPVTWSEYIYAYTLLAIPVKLNYLAGKRNLRFIGSIGAAPYFLLTDKVISERTFTDGHTETERMEGNTGRFVFSPMVSAGIDYRMGQSIHLRVEPVFRYGRQYMKDDSYTPGSPFWRNVGLNIGFYSSFPGK